MSCPCCAAPLPATDVVCQYCGHRIDFDLQTWKSMQSMSLGEKLQCPECQEDLDHVEIENNKANDRPIRLGKCKSCLGLFLPIGTLEQLLASSSTTATSVNRRVLNNLLKANHASESTMRYRPCPSCSTLMHRKLHGKLSGVIVDSCRDHGVWLDAGELRQLMEWTQAGGALLDEEKRTTERRDQECRDRQDSRARAKQRGSMGAELMAERLTQRRPLHRGDSGFLQALLDTLFNDN